MTSKQADQILVDITNDKGGMQRQRHRWRREHERSLAKHGVRLKRDV